MRHYEVLQDVTNLSDGDKEFVIYREDGNPNWYVFSTVDIGMGQNTVNALNAAEGNPKPEEEKAPKPEPSKLLDGLTLGDPESIIKCALRILDGIPTGFRPSYSYRGPRTTYSPPRGGSYSTHYTEAMQARSQWEDDKKTFFMIMARSGRYPVVDLEDSDQKFGSQDEGVDYATSKGYDVHISLGGAQANKPGDLSVVYMLMQDKHEPHLFVWHQVN